MQMDLDFARHMIDQYGYLAVFISTFIEGEAVVLVAAALTASGLLQAHWVIAAAALGAYIGHTMFFVIGRWKGMELIEAFPFLRRHYPKANLIMDKYANWSVFVFQYLYGLRLVSAILFGCSTITFPRFLLLQVLNCISWACLVFFAGHVLGMIAMTLFEMVGLYGLLLIAGLLALLALLLYHRYGHHHVKVFLSSGREVSIEQVDPVEGRHFTLEQLDYHMQLAARSKQPLSLLLLKIPALSGEHADEHLDHIARDFCHMLRLADVPARFSKDTFAVVAPSTDAEGARQAMARLLPGFFAEAASSDEGFLASLYIGIAQWQPGQSSGQLIDAAFHDMHPY